MIIGSEEGDRVLKRGKEMRSGSRNETMGLFTKTHL